jgi:hypothetical protein
VSYAHSCKSTVLGAAFLAGVAIAANADPTSTSATGRSPTARAVPNRKAAVSRLSQSSVRRDRGGDRLFARSRQRIPEIAGEQVAAPTDRPDQVTVRPKDVAQCRNLSLKGVFLNVAVGPDAAYQRVLPDDSPDIIGFFSRGLAEAPSGP